MHNPNIIFPTRFAYIDKTESVDFNNNEEFISIIKKKYKGEDLKLKEKNTNSSDVTLESYFSSEDKTKESEKENILANRAILRCLFDIKNNSIKKDICTMIIGPMFAGKTNTMIKDIEESVKNGILYVCISPAIDDRFEGNNIKSHNENTTEVNKIDFGRPDKKSSVNDLVINKGLILFSEICKEKSKIYIDEGQFFPIQLIPTIIEYHSKGKQIIVNGLNLSYNGTPLLHTIAILLLLTNNITRVKGKCYHCAQEDSTEYSMRNCQSNKKDIVIGEDIVIGNDYIPLCSECFKNTNTKNTEDIYVSNILEYKKSLVNKLQELKKIVNERQLNHLL